MNFFLQLNNLLLLVFSSRLFRILTVLMIAIISVNMWSQNFDNFGKAKLLKVNGGVSANAVFYEGETNREAFTYFLSGNLNFNIKGIYNIPLSFSYSNQEFETNRPFTFNRLSLHPSYKWVATHIGNINMSFSPYTLNGHQFTGFGADLTPNKPFKVSFMYGRLQKEVPFQAQDSLSVPVYRRIGYGLKANYKFEKWDVSAIAFKATDQRNSIGIGFPATFGVTPKDNFVGSLSANVAVLKKLQVSTEIANSVITEDLNANAGVPNKTTLSSFVETNATTQEFRAYNAQLSYPLASGSIGATYERIDPEYRTLGAYFFNNDLENITINASQNILKGKVSVALNSGLQRDDLDDNKDSKLRRIVSAVNIGYTPNEKTNISGSFSNFSSFTNIKNQFDVINELRPTDNIDTLDFQQISRNASLSIAQRLKNTKKNTQNLNLNLSFQTARSLQNEKLTENGLSNFYNAAATYNLGWPQKDLTIATSANATLNEIGIQKSITLGPTVNINKLFFEKKLRTSLSTSYNQSLVDSEKQSEVLNLRANAGYVVAKRHNFNLSLLSQLRSSIATESIQDDFTATLSYSYSFDNFKLKFPKPNAKDNKNTKDSKRRKEEKDEEVLKLVYRDRTFEGTKSSINAQLKNMQNTSEFEDIPKSKREEIDALRAILSEEKNEKAYKKKALAFLDGLYDYKDYTKAYEGMLQSVIGDLHNQMANLDYKFEKEYTNSLLQLKAHELYNIENPDKPLSGDETTKESYAKLNQTVNTRGQKLATHRWMEPLIKSYASSKTLPKDDKLLQKFIELEKDKVFRMYNNAPVKAQIEGYLLGQLLEFYSKESLKEIDIKDIKLKHTLKN